MSRYGQRVRRWGGVVAVGAVVATVLTMVAGPGSPPAEAAPTSGVLTIEVNRDFSGDGVYDALFDPGQPGITVQVTDGQVVHTELTDGTGRAAFDLSTFAGTAFRVDVSIDDPDLDHLQAAPAAPATTANAFRSFTSVVDDATQTLHVGVWNPDTYTTRNPQLAVVEQNDRGGSPSLRSVMVTDWDNRGPANMVTSSNTTGIRTVATQGETGTVFGSAWEHRSNLIYTAAYAKAHTVYGPGGNGAIYRTDAGGTAPGSTETWATVPNAGSSVHQTTTGYDDAFFLANGREGLGGLALSEDGTTLYTVNLNDRSLYSFSTASPAPAPVQDVVAIGDPGCAPTGDWRPFAVTVRDGEVYVGGVCDASTSLDRSDLVAQVLRLDGTTFVPVFQHVLDFARGNQNYADPPGNLTGPGVATHWNPWRTTWDADLAASMLAGPLYPTPLLTSLQFENDGSLILGLRDRISDAVVRNGYSPDPDNRTRVTGMIVGGDINKACLTGGVYEWEGTGSCSNNHTPANSGGEPAGRVEFFPGDFFDGMFNYGANIHHYENSMGGVVVAPREPDVANTTMDATGLYNTGGIGFYDRVDGSGPGNDPHGSGLLIAGNESHNFGKGNGLGDLSLLAAQAPIQIGNRVWFDADHNGAQDASPDEPGIPGATVRLLSADGTEVLATTTTDANGEYYFGGEGGYPLEPGVDYIVEFDLSAVDPTGLPGSPTLEQLRYTLVEDPTAGPEHDSNAVPQPDSRLIGRATVTAPQPGGVDHSIDAGVSPASASIEKGDTGSAVAGPIVNDADTSVEGQGYESGESRAITFEVTNDGAKPLYNVTVADALFGGDVSVDGLACTFPGQTAPGTAGTRQGANWVVHWAETFGSAVPAPVAWESGVTFTCSASLTLVGDDAPHVDQASVRTSMTPSGSPGDAPQNGPSDEDDYVAFTGAIQVIKYDGTRPDPEVGSGPTGWTPPTKPLIDADQDANTTDEAVVYPADAAQPVRWVVTNTGATWLTDVSLGDATDDGPAIGPWVCDLSPVGGPAEHSFVDDGSWVGPLAPGASFFCEGDLTLPESSTHGDTVTVTAVVVVPVLDEDGQPVLDDDGVPTYHTDLEGEPLRSTVEVGDDDPFHAETPAGPPPTTTTTTTVPGGTTTTTAAPTVSGSSSKPTPPGSAVASGLLPRTGADVARFLLVALGLVALGAAMVVIGRRRVAAPRRDR